VLVGVTALTGVNLLWIKVLTIKWCC
jgi:hypothetical protein